MIVRFVDVKPGDFSEIGVKGVCLGEMTQKGLNVPPGFIIPAEVGRRLRDSGGHLPDALMEEIGAAVADLERQTGKRFGGSKPLLLSVRSGAAVPMPGMMDTIINLGMNTEVIKSMEETEDEHFVFDCYRRFLQLYGQVAMGVKATSFEKALQDTLNRAGVFSEEDLEPSQLRRLTDNYTKLIRKAAGRSVPADPNVQLREAIEGIFRSWDNPRATVYRRLHRIPDDIGTAAIVQAMVFGNRGDNCASGLVVTRDPIAGTNQLFGEYLLYSQGEDVLSGTRTPKKIHELQGDMYDIYQEGTGNRVHRRGRHAVPPPDSPGHVYRPGQDQNHR